eukprot:PLAT7613.1.p1 GENE.PLAT7613.1~~PLAT7613.1.p1  ORF type:complete len:666 (+),score=258.74 PLAT7613.1:36-2000(+)
MEAKFSALLERLKSMLPAGAADLRSSIESRLQGAWDEPQEEDISAALGREVGVEEARTLLFFPSAQQMAAYPAILSQRDGVGAPKRPAVACLGTLYLFHTANWHLLSAFITAGGCDALAQLLTVESGAVRSQAIDTLLQMTSHDSVDWFKPAESDGMRCLHAQLLALVQTGPLVPALLRCRGAEAPVSSYFALQLLAFLLSWARLLHAKEQMVRLSSDFLQQLREWASQEGASDEEKQLAGKLAEDFGRFEPATHGLLVDLGLDEEEVLRMQRSTRAEQCKQQGNRAFGKGQWEEAAALYSEAAALDATAAAMPANRAACFFKLGRFEECVADCDAALALDATYSKAFFRKAQALQKLERLDEAVAVLHEALALDGKRSSAMIELCADLERQQRAAARKARVFAAASASEEKNALVAAILRRGTVAVGAKEELSLDELAAAESGAAESKREAESSGSEAAPVAPSVAALQGGRAAAAKEEEQRQEGEGSGEAEVVPLSGMLGLKMTRKKKKNKTTAAASKKPSKKTKKKKKKKSGAAALLASLPAEVPNTLSNWQRLDASAQAAAFAAAPDGYLAALMASSMDDALLAATAALLREDSVRSDVASSERLLRELSGVPRVDMAVMMLSSSQRSQLASDIAGVEGEVSAELAARFE